MQIPADFITFDYLATFAGMVVAILLIVQFTKGVIKQVFSDQAVRLYTFSWALLFVIVMAWVKGSFAVEMQGIAQQALLCLLNAILVTIAAMGGYEMFADPKAEKQKPS